MDELILCFGSDEGHPGEVGLEGGIIATMPFLNSDSIKQDDLLERSTSFPPLPSSFFTIPFEFIQGEEDNDCAALLKDHTAIAAAPHPPCLSRTSRTKSFVGHNGKENAHSTKKQLFLDMDCHNADSEDEFADPCTPLSPGSNTSSKRLRATHVHNLSEKRRRNRINEKMKALQLLIPNSKKTDKASILDEIIDYVKQLQLQVQTLSSPNKMNPSHICVPMGIPCFQMPHMCMNMNLGSMGMGINMTHSHSPSHWNNGCTTVPQGVQGQPILWANEGNKECFHTAGLPMFTKVSQHNNVCGAASGNTSQTQFLQVNRIQQP